MAETRGGYQRPTNPAPVSLPGALSSRTDGGPTQAAKYYSGMGYGQGTAMMQQQQAAPMAGNPVASVAAASAPSPMLPPVTGITEPTQEPDSPITSGVAYGPGPGPEALMLPSVEDMPEDKRRIISYLPALEVAAQSPNSSQAFRNYVRLIKASINE